MPAEDALEEGARMRSATMEVVLLALLAIEALILLSRFT